MKIAIPVIASALFLIGMNSCKNSAANFTERKLVIASKETVKVKELDLVITNYGCGRQWLSDDGNKGYEKPYCELEIKYKDSIINAGNDFKPIYIGEAEVVLDRINPWGVVEDSIPPGGCRVWVKKHIRH